MCLRKGKINYWINLPGNSAKNYTQNKNIPYNAKKKLYCNLHPLLRASGSRCESETISS